MSKALAKKLYSILFLTIFMSKMVISIAPFLVAHFDSKSVNAAIMQLEIENHSKPTDLKELSIKEYLTIASYAIPPSSHQILADNSGNNHHAKHIQSFYPSVPTPPPNV